MAAKTREEELAEIGVFFASLYNGVLGGLRDGESSLPKFRPGGKGKLCNIMAAFATQAITRQQTGEWGTVCDTAAAMAIEVSREVFREDGIETAIETTEDLLAELGGVWVTRWVPYVKGRMAIAIATNDPKWLARILRSRCYPAQTGWRRSLLYARFRVNSAIDALGTLLIGSPYRSGDLAAWTKGRNRQ